MADPMSDQDHEDPRRCPNGCEPEAMTVHRWSQPIAAGKRSYEARCAKCGYTKKWEFGPGVERRIPKPWER